MATGSLFRSAPHSASGPAAAARADPLAASGIVRFVTVSRSQRRTIFRKVCRSEAEDMPREVIGCSFKMRRPGVPLVPEAATSEVQNAPVKELNLEDIRGSLIRQEDTIIFNLIERAQYLLNSGAYDPNRFPIPGFDGSLVQYMLKETEHLHAKVGRFNSPDEHPFFPEDLPKATTPPLEYPHRLHRAGDGVNINQAVWSMYFDNLLPHVAGPGDDGNYGSSSTLDVLCLQALSKRIHYGKFVAETKYREDPTRFETAIRAQDVDALMELITYPIVEQKLVDRVQQKALVYGQELDITGKPISQHYRVAPELIAKLYKDWVMPLTKKVQVQYLLRRLD